MRLKLMRKDCSEPECLYLDEGNHVIGREILLNCKDKRISRKHCSIQVGPSGDVVFKSLHSNPCFYYERGAANPQVIQQHEERTWRHGDDVALLPGVYRFTLEEGGDTTQDTQVTDSTQDTPNTLDINGAEDTHSTQDTQETCNTLDTNGALNTLNTEDAHNTTDVCGTSNSIQATHNLEETLDTNNRQETLNTEETPDTNSRQHIDNAPDTENTDDVDPPDDDVVAIETPVTTVDLTHTQESPCKRGASDVLGGEQKRARLEGEGGEDVKPNVEQLQQDALGGQGSSGEGGKEGSSGESGKKESGEGEEKESKDVKPRQNCQYGDQCYRKNPSHRTECSHPGDSDWAPQPCEYGLQCYRQNPLHRRIYSHPGPPAPRPHPVPPYDPAALRTVRVMRNGNVFNITAHAVNFYDDHFEVQDFDMDSVDYDYEF